MIKSNRKKWEVLIWYRLAIILIPFLCFWVTLPYCSFLLFVITVNVKAVYVLEKQYYVDEIPSILFRSNMGL